MELVHNAEFHGEAAVLDRARGGAVLGKLDLIDGLFLVGPANVAERDQVVLVEEEDAAALDVVRPAIGEGNLAEGFLVDRLDRNVGAVRNRRRLEDTRRLGDSRGGVSGDDQGPGFLTEGRSKRSRRPAPGS